jgi:hypothetical protein
VAAPRLTGSELRSLRALLRRKVRFMVVGLSAAAMQGAPVVTQDVELWFEDLHDPRLAQALRDMGAAYVPPSILNPPMFALAGTELFDIVLRMSGLGTFAEEFSRCVDVPLSRYRLKVLSLERILESKRAANRPKDVLVIHVLEDSLATITTAKKATTRAHRKNSPRRIR